LELFLDRGRPYLLAEPVLNNVILTVAEAHRDRNEGDRWWLAVDAGGTVRGAAMRTVPHGLLLAATTRDVAEALAEAQDAPIPEATATTGVVRWFVDRYREVSGVPAGLIRSSRIYSLDRVVPPTGVPGRARQATAADLDVLLSWSGAFAAEAMADQPRGDLRRPVDARLGHDGLLWMWEDAGEPVAMTWVTPPVAGIVRISGVYTPPDRRGRGYASGCVAAASSYALGTLAHTCMLYTDLGNPTSNRIYQAIGYVPVADCDSWRFGS
jgi:predicted GNAT family acetyltransferase